jgi:AmmeMemoRadiSam system protein A
VELSDAHGRLLLELACSTIRGTLHGRPPPSIDDVADPALTQLAGCYVSLHASASHALRGCVGRMEAREPLVRCVRDTAMSVLADPRFDDRRVRIDELPGLDIEISILSPLRPVPTPLDFDPLNDGIYLMLNGRCGVFLPQVARETGWRRDQLLDRLCTEKMGFPAGSWRFAGAQLFIFSTKILGPVPFV